MKIASACKIRPSTGWNNCAQVPRNHNMRFSENSSGPLKHPILESLNVQLHQNIRSQLHSGEDIVQAMDLDLFVSSTACLREGLLVQVRHGEQRRGCLLYTSD